MALRCFEQFKRRRPELQVQNLAFARQHIVLDIEAQHRRQMRIDDGVGDQMREFRQFARAGFDRMQRLRAPRERFGMVLVVLRSACVEIPANVIETVARQPSVPRLQPAFSFRENESRPPHPRPARRCCRCNSALRRGCRGRAACVRKCRPIRRCAGGRYARLCWD